MQYILRYHLKENQALPYQEWHRNNEAAIAESTPPGWHYLGTWFTVHGFGRFECETRWELDNYNALEPSEPTEEWLKLFHEQRDFVDQSRPMETALLKSASDVRVIE